MDLYVPILSLADAIGRRSRLPRVTLLMGRAGKPSTCNFMQPRPVLGSIAEKNWQDLGEGSLSAWFDTSSWAERAAEVFGWDS